MTMNKNIYKMYVSWTISSLYCLAIFIFYCFAITTSRCCRIDGTKCHEFYAKKYYILQNDLLDCFYYCCSSRCCLIVEFEWTWDVATTAMRQWGIVVMVSLQFNWMRRKTIILSGEVGLRGKITFITG